MDTADANLRAALGAYRKAYPQSKPTLSVNIYPSTTWPEEWVALISAPEDVEAMVQGSGPTLDAAAEALCKNLNAKLRTIYEKELKAYNAYAERAIAHHKALLDASNDALPPADNSMTKNPGTEAITLSFPAGPPKE